MVLRFRSPDEYHAICLTVMLCITGLIVSRLLVRYDALLFGSLGLFLGIYVEHSYAIVARQSTVIGGRLR